MGQELTGWLESSLVGLSIARWGRKYPGGAGINWEVRKEPDGAESNYEGLELIRKCEK